jgi:hypothetical protein
MAVNPGFSKFRRYAYGNRYRIVGEDQRSFDDEMANKPVFTGGDLQAWINNIKVGNLESITCSISVEVAGNYVMGRRDAVLYSTGKRVLVGSLVFSQYDKHALLEQVFQVSRNNIATIGDLWSPDHTDAYSLASDNAVLTTPTGVGASAAYLELARDEDTGGGSFLGALGLTREQFNEQLKEQLVTTARLVGARKFNYSDQLPPFDLTLTGVTQAGQAAACSIFGIQISQETFGFSQNDIGNSVGMSFVALAATPWRPVDPSSSGGQVTIPGI